MVTKTAVNGDAHAARTFGASASDLARDVGELLELEAKVLLADVEKAKRRFVSGVVMAVAAIVVAMAALPILFAALAWALVEFAQWSAAAAFGFVSVVALVAAATAIYFAWKKIVDCGSAFSRSRAEWKSSVRCITNAVQALFRARMTR
jgi:hypothetical protein